MVHMTGKRHHHRLTLQIRWKLNLKRITVKQLRRPNILFILKPVGLQVLGVRLQQNIQQGAGVFKLFSEMCLTPENLQMRCSTTERCNDSWRKRKSGKESSWKALPKWRPFTVGVKSITEGEQNEKIVGREVGEGGQHAA